MTLVCTRNNSAEMPAWPRAAVTCYCLG